MTIPWYAPDSREAESIGSHIIIDNLAEQTIRFESVGTHDRLMQVGDGATFFNNIYDADDNIVGNTVGIVIALMKRNPDDHLVTSYTEAIQLPDGMLRSYAIIDRQQLLTGSAVRLEVVGTAGAYLGMKGIRECQLLPPYPPPDDARVTLKFSLHTCPDGTDGRLS